MRAATSLESICRSMAALWPYDRSRFQTRLLSSLIPGLQVCDFDHEIARVPCLLEVCFRPKLAGMK